MKNKFESVKINDIVSFYNYDNLIESDIVFEVKDNIFRVKANKTWNKNGVIVISDSIFSFYKNGTKTNHKYNHGNAIEIN